jgi:enhancing lycopene biosynthesis protein 2
MKKIGVLLSGCGVYDGSEIHEATLSLLAIDQQAWQAVCMAPDIQQHEVVNHKDKNIMEPARNVLQESARIARGEIKNLSTFSFQDYAELDALVLPGGFGAAKNLSHWAFLGHQATVLDEVKALILYFLQYKKPIVALCIAPVVVAKALEDRKLNLQLTVGGDEKTEKELELLGVQIQKTNAQGLAIDEKNKIISAPCYMRSVSIQTIFQETQAAMHQLAEWLK